MTFKNYKLIWIFKTFSLYLHLLRSSFGKPNKAQRKNQYFKRRKRTRNSGKAPNGVAKTGTSRAKKTWKRIKKVIFNLAFVLIKKFF